MGMRVIDSNISLLAGEANVLQRLHNSPLAFIFPDTRDTLENLSDDHLSRVMKDSDLRISLQCLL